MSTTAQNIETLKDIRRMMERSSRFISLSGLSGITAGVAGLAGAWLANREIESSQDGCVNCLRDRLVMIAAVVFIVAFVTAILFTYLKSRKQGVPIWGLAARRLLWNTLLPMLAGGLLIVKMIVAGVTGFLAPVALFFYGLGLVNGSKYTMGEVRFLGYGQLLLGAASLLDLHHPIGFLAAGFGGLHIIYGAAMWWKYDRKHTGPTV